MVTRLSSRLFVWIAFAAGATWLGAAPPQQASSSAPPVAQQRALLQKTLDKYCVACHNQRLRTAGLALDTLDLDNVPARAEVWEAVIRKLRGGMMPPVGSPQPDKASAANLVTALETSLDRAYFVKVNPGRVGLQRLHH